MKTIQKQQGNCSKYCWIQRLIETSLLCFRNKLTDFLWNQSVDFILQDATVFIQSSNYTHLTFNDKIINWFFMLIKKCAHGNRKRNFYVKIKIEI
jgi:hypothetical protein